MAHVTNFSSSKSDHKTERYYSNNSESLVRIVLFKECKFKERQLLFDSFSPNNTKNNEPVKCRNVLLQPYSKSSEEFSQLTEMIFGSTAMRYHGTYFKVHSVSSPERIVITQVFATPYKKRLKKSTSSFNSKKLLHSLSEWDIKYEENSIMSMSDNFSNISLESSIFRKNIPNTTSHSSTVDSGFSEQSLYSSLHSTSQFDSLASLENFPTVSSKLESSSSLNAFGNTPDCFTNSNLGYSRLGLAIIISVATEKNKYQYFIMNHISFIESILWRIRQYIEYTINTSRSFLLQMFHITNESTQYLENLSCDFKFIEKFWDRDSFSENFTTQLKLSILSKFRKIVADKFKALKYRPRTDRFERACRLIEYAESKETNFFLSSLLTAVLTHYLGWIMTSYESNYDEDTKKYKNSYNALWNQFKDLHGQTGISTISQIIICNSDKNILKDTLDFLLYFIRYTIVQRREIERENIVAENEIVNNIINTGYVDFNENMKYKKTGGFSLRKSISKSKTFSSNLSELGNIEQCLDVVPEEESVIFILGDDEKLVDLKKNDITTLDTCCDSDISAIVENKENSRSMEKQSNAVKKAENKLKMKVVKFPLPKVKVIKDYIKTMPYEFYLNSNAMDILEPSLSLQGTTAAEQTWKSRIRNDLFSSHSYIAENNLEETVAILGDMNKWKAQVLSSNKRSVLRTSSNEIIDTSQLLADMLEVTLQMWKLGIPIQYCITHIEQRLLEICLKSNAVAKLLFSSDFCTMDILLSTLNVNLSDMPLLMSVVSSLCPEVTKKYGLSYQ